MREQRIIIAIDREGQIIAESDGFTGDACLETLARLLEDLAPGTASVQRKPDTQPPIERKCSQTQTRGRQG